MLFLMKTYTIILPKLLVKRTNVSVKGLSLKRFIYGGYMRGIAEFGETGIKDIHNIYLN